MSLPLSDPDVFRSILSTGWNLATGNQTDELPSALAGAGKFVLENWSPLASAGQVLVGRSNGNTSGGMALSAMGLGLTAGVAKLGLSLLQRRLQSRDGGRVGRAKDDRKKDPLRGLNARSKTLKKAHREPTVHSSRPPSSPPAPARPTPTPLQQLSMLFPSLDRSLLGDMLASNQGSLETTIDQLLSINIDSATPTPAVVESGQRFQFPPSSVSPTPLSSSSSPLPPCPECPVCFTSLASKRIFQCANGHHVCQDCKKNPQLKVCPTCRQKLVGRATNMEQFLTSIYGKK